mmetsp:Transcript_21889/g.32622  ORF Transcript_21889/g.32622 Transcript_21889/m.32622 type:complete len:260 (+) Transcript_21889:77-856(+)
MGSGMVRRCCRICCRCGKKVKSDESEEENGDNEWVNLEQGSWDGDPTLDGESTTIEIVKKPPSQVKKKVRTRSRIKLQGAMQVPPPSATPLSAMIEKINTRQYEQQQKYSSGNIESQSSTNIESTSMNSRKEEDNEEKEENVKKESFVDPFSMVGIAPSEQRNPDDLIRRVKPKVVEPEVPVSFGNDSLFQMKVEDNANLETSWGDDNLTGLVDVDEEEEGSKTQQGKRSKGRARRSSRRKVRGIGAVAIEGNADDDTL